MRKIDKAVKRETLYVLVWTLALSVLMNIVFVAIGKWDLTVLFGTLLGASVAVCNFFLMGLTVQAAVAKDEKSARRTVRYSMLAREALILGVGILGVLLDCFNVFAVLIPFFFPRISLIFRSLFGIKDEDKSEGEAVSEKTAEENEETDGKKEEKSEEN